ncbi:hypothetical protein ACFY05_31755 [Microtetraspora fusca]|uniref:Uncharacterized protein n=1 Tax=Microtetraspora fusca TaxID=1997 RepID=A0ABW6VDL4_MICFU
MTRELSPASDWCQRWSPGRRHSWRHRHEGGFDRDRYGVTPLPEADAKTFVTGLHYSGTYPAAVHRYGLWDVKTSPRLVGVAVLSVPTNRRTLTNAFPHLDAYSQSLELGRFVLTDDVPGNGETFFLAEAFRLAAEQGVRGLVSFADPLPRTTIDGHTVFTGHRGAIYQAANADYAGRSTAGTRVLLPDGTTLSNRALAKVTKGECGHEYVERLLISHGAAPRLPDQSGADWLRQARAEAHVRTLHHPGNHRYLFRLGTKAQRRRVTIAMPAQPYPKDRTCRQAAGQVAA